MSFMLMPISSTPIGPANSIVGKLFSRTSTSTRRLSSLPERSCVRSFSRVRAKFSSRGSFSGTSIGAVVSPESKSKRGLGPGGFGGGSNGWQHLSSHAVAQGDGHRALRCFLPNDVLVEFDNDLPRRHLVETHFLLFSFTREIDNHCLNQMNHR